MKNSPKPKGLSKPAPHLLIAAGLLVLAAAAYANAFDAGFALDNRGLILQDPRLRAATAENLDSILSHSYWWPYGESGLYRPFTTLSYLFNYAVLGNREHAAGYVLINLLLHALNVLLAYSLARRWLPGFWHPAAVAGLWAVHPVLTESITNIAGRSDLLAGAAVLGGFWLYLKSGESSGLRRLACLAGLAAATTIGVFSKESAVTILGIAALYDVVWQRPPKFNLLVGYGCMLLPILAMWWVRSQVLAASDHAVFTFTDNPLVGAGFWQGKLTALAVLGHYVWLTFWPMRLSSDYSFAQIPLARGSFADWAAWLTLAAVLSAAAWLYRRNRAGAFFLLFAIVNLAAVANLLFPIGTIMADRFLYLPALGFCAWAVTGTSEVLHSRVAAATVLAIAIAASAARTHARNADWRDDLALASADVEASPASFKTHYRLAQALYESDPGHGNIDGVTAEAEKSLAILSALPDSRNTSAVYRSAGGYYLVKGDRSMETGPDGKAIATEASRSAYARSVQLLDRCLAILSARRREGLKPASSEEAQVLYMLAAGYLGLSETAKALTPALEARRLDPLNPQIYRELFNIRMSQERTFDAATMMVEGGVITGDPAMRRQLLDLYKMGLDPTGCAVLPGTGALNPGCETVHNQLCAAASDLDKLARETPRSDVATQLKQIPAAGCSPEAR